jgi:hypothetical protein
MFPQNTLPTSRDDRMTTVLTSSTIGRFAAGILPSIRSWSCHGNSGAKKAKPIKEDKTSISHPSSLIGFPFYNK